MEIDLIESHICGDKSSNAHPYIAVTDRNK